MWQGTFVHALLKSELQFQGWLVATEANWAADLEQQRSVLLRKSLLTDIATLLMGQMWHWSSQDKPKVLSC